MKFACRRPLRIAEEGALLFSGFRRTYPYSVQTLELLELWKRDLAELCLKERIGTEVFGVMCGANESGFEYIHGVRVSRFSDEQSRIAEGRIRTNPERYAVFEHSGYFCDLRDTWTWILQEWFTNSEYETAHRPDFERYDESYDWSTGTGRIEIWLAVKPRGT